MPVEKCSSDKKKKGEKNCEIAIEWEENPQKLYDLLERTEKNFKTTDPGFLSSDLGKRYQELKNFMEVHKNFNQCNQKLPLWTKGRFKDIIEGFTQDVSYAKIAKNPCHFEAASRDIGSYQLKNVQKALEYTPQKGPESRESLLQSQILDAALKKSIEAHITFAIQFQNKNPLDSNFQKSLIDKMCVRETPKGRRRKLHQTPCQKEDRRLFESLVRKKSETLAQSSIPSMNEEEIVKDINEKIDKLNQVLAIFNRRTQEIQKNWHLEFQGQTDRYKKPGAMKEILTKRKAMENELLDFKREVFTQYRIAFAELHSSGAGELFQTETVKSKMGLDQLEKLDPDLFGIMGFNIEQLKKIDSFPVLEKIDPQTAKKAISESLSRTEDQGRKTFNDKKKKESDDKRYLDDLEYINRFANSSQKGRSNLQDHYKKSRIRELEKLIPINRGLLGGILLNGPKNADIICAVAKNLAVKRRNRETIETAVYIGMGATLITVSLASPFVSIPGRILAATASAGGSFRIGDLIYKRVQSHRHKKIHEQMLNAYLSSSGNRQSIDRIREEWNQALQNNYNSKVSVFAWLADYTVLPRAVRLGAWTRVTRKTYDFKTESEDLKEEVHKIINDQANLNSINDLFDLYPQENIGHLVSFIGELPKDKKAFALHSLDDFSKQETIYPNGIKPLLETMQEKGIFDDNPIEFTTLMIQNNAENMKIIEERKSRFLKDEKFKNIIQKHSGEKQKEIVSDIAFLLGQGRSQDEIVRRFNKINALPVP
ncbi:MAG: hypothetical protein OXB88_05765 [Bacteriovoracales bacterium]|nr:hypothetical protein [Bacteriovoracales bacterium]